MLILGIESSCDETSAAVIKGSKNSEKVKSLSNIVASSVNLHARTGGIIPEIAAREQVRFIIPVINDALKSASISKDKPEIDAIAVTVGPGLIGSLLVGVETAKSLSYIWNKPIIPVNHLLGHIYANFIDEGQEEIEFPIISLIVSGAHTDLVLIKNHKNFIWLGGTRDDAAG
ncbi:MAG: tRNA (adenosine(37)-N6)-threonylcarbamoyltransferase complex transferase subunit TsaD, partial [Candidatus Levybacteria bacterium]|nr:tRNA (adenosine(37)-N6)-threonylcarbamoyltransferase complex transferase subunit TsaD [Candidatus Levybacteria bacterium]